MIAPIQPRTWDRIDIMDPFHGGMAVESLSGVEVRQGQPVDVVALAAIVRVCPSCTAIMSAEERWVRITSAGQWYGTKVVDAETAETIASTFSILIRAEVDDIVRAGVLAHYQGDPRYIASLCPACAAPPSWLKRTWAKAQGWWLRGGRSFTPEGKA